MQHSSRRGRSLQLALASTLVILFSPASSAQSVSGTILGTVRDSSSAIIAAAPVVVTNQATNIDVRVETNSSGYYVATNLAPGTYTVKVEMSGFSAQIVRDIRLLANREARVDVELSAGVVTEIVEVRASAATVNSENSTIGNVMESAMIHNLPINGRQIDRLVQISAGVTSDSASNPRIAGSSYWGGAQYSVEGIVFNDVNNGGAAYSNRGLMSFPSVEAISEFKIDSNSQKAEFDGTVSVSVVMKSGSNEFHGSLFEYNRNKAAAAKNFFATSLPKPTFNRNEFGGTLGGPILKNRTFFFVDYESMRERSARTNKLSVATQAMRDGDFTGLPQLTDPLSGSPFPENRIPASRITSISSGILKYSPLPNGPGTGAAGTMNNYVENVGNTINIGRLSGRFDHRFSDRDSVSGGFTDSKGDPFFLAQNYPSTYGHWENAGHRSVGLNSTYLHTFTGTTLNEARLGWLYHKGVRFGMNSDVNARDWFPQLSSSLDYGGLPDIRLTGMTNIGDYGRTLTKQYSLQFTDNFTHIRGSHTIKTGVNIENDRFSRPPSVMGLGSGTANESAFGRFDFSGRYSAGGGTAQPANVFADYLLGYPSSTYRSAATASLLFYSTRYGAYVQDDWRVSPRVTVNLGVRYFVQTTWRERDNAMANFDFDQNKLVLAGTGVPAQAQPALMAAYPIASGGGNQFRTPKNNWGPRAGIAWKPFHSNRTVVRAGGGLYYNMINVAMGFTGLGFSNAPFLLAETFEAAAGKTPSLSFDNPFPGQGKLAANPSISAVDPDLKYGRSMQWNFSVEQEVGSGIGLRASYIGNKTNHLLYYARQANWPAVQAAGTLQSQRPYQPWADISYTTFGGDAFLNQLQLEAIKRYSSGLTFQVEYAWNRSLDDTPISGAPQNPYCNRCDYGNSDQVRRQVFTASYSYDLPFGSGKKFLSNAGRTAGYLVKGWTISGITLLESGTPFSVMFSSSTPGWQSSRADILHDAALDPGERSISRWFDTTAFTNPAPFTYGNSARNALLGPGVITVDLSASKSTMFRDRYVLQIRADFFNMPNHANFGNPGNNRSTTGSFGIITSASDARQIQFGAKLLF